MQVPDAQPFKCTCGAGKTGLPCTCHEEYQPLQDSLLPPSEQQINAAAPPQHANGSDEFSTGLCECVQGPQSCYICMSSWLLPCFSYAHVRDHAAGSGTKHPCSMFCVLTTLPQFIPYVGGIVTTVSRTVLGMQGRQLLRQKYGLKEDDCGGAFLISPAPFPVELFGCLQRNCAKGGLCIQLLCCLLSDRCHPATA